MSKIKRFIENMPKDELHVHLEGTLEPELKLALANRNGIKLPYKNAKAVKAAYKFHDLTSFLVGYYEGMSVLVKEHDVYDLTWAYLAKVFARAREEGYLLTMHCDVDQQDSVDHIWQCVRDIGVGRVDHGVNALEDEKLCQEIKRRGLGLTVCPISNAYVTDGTKAAAI